MWKGIDEGLWYPIKIKVRGSNFECYVDDSLVFEESNSSFSHGRIGITTRGNQTRFRKIKVTAPDGKLLWEGLPDIGSQRQSTELADSQNSFTLSRNTT